MQGDILTKTKDTYEKVMRIIHFLNRKGVYIVALDPERHVVRRDFQYQLDGDGSTEQGYGLHILATKLNVVLYILAFVTGAASMWKRER